MHLCFFTELFFWFHFYFSLLFFFILLFLAKVARKEENMRRVSSGMSMGVMQKNPNTPLVIPMKKKGGEGGGKKMVTTRIGVRVNVQCPPHNRAGIRFQTRTVGRFSLPAQQKTRREKISAIRSTKTIAMGFPEGQMEARAKKEALSSRNITLLQNQIQKMSKSEMGISKDVTALLKSRIETASFAKAGPVPFDLSSMVPPAPPIVPNPIPRPPPGGGFANVLDDPNTIVADSPEDFRQEAIDELNRLIQAPKGPKKDLEKKIFQDSLALMLLTEPTLDPDADTENWALETLFVHNGKKVYIDGQDYVTIKDDESGFSAPLKPTEFDSLSYDHLKDTANLVFGDKLHFRGLWYKKTDLLKP